MRGFRLKGWQRIGIVLSVLWAVGAWLYIEAAGSKAADEAFKSSHALCTREKMARNDFDPKACFDEAKDREDSTFSDWSVRAWLVALAPIPIAWLLIYIVVWTVRWIRRGFQPST